jgi:hypothetical protein
VRKSWKKILPTVYARTCTPGKPGKAPNIVLTANSSFSAFLELVRIIIGKKKSWKVRKIKVQL